MVVEAGRPVGGARVDVQALARDMLTAHANPDALGHDKQRRLVDRYNAAVRQPSVPSSTEALRADLAGSDLGARMRAAAALQACGEPVDDATVQELLATYNGEVEAVVAARAALDPAAFPEVPAEVVEGLRAVQEAQRAPADPLEAAIGKFNDFVSNLRPPTIEWQLEALGVEPESVSTSNTGAREA
jgi:hypothetical protein